jgi:hypothetical protein
MVDEKAFCIWKSERLVIGIWKDARKKIKSKRVLGHKWCMNSELGRTSDWLMHIGMTGINILERKRSDLVQCQL